VNSIVKASHVPHKLIESWKGCSVNWAKLSQQISQPVLVQAIELMDGREY